ncbi:RloB domain-containing protein [Frischella sp. Ac13]|uniref:RloB domain-containing protein n=1 Tax=Frischella japonica TaxID=2741544 RepID=A0ABR7QWY6_9GAMM|nr:RloB family protein [Frischella japonica]MBC9130473.1 RloB domain-containing protein [Frischella japonica]
MGSEDLKKKKINENKKSRANRKDIRRNNNYRPIIPKILILTEGVSEKIYFEGLKNKFSLSTLSVMKSEYTDSVGLIKNAIKIAEESIQKHEPYDYIFCVFDLDTVNNKNFINKIIIYENQNPEQPKVKIFPIYTYPCFEIWFILHFDLCTKPFTSKGKKSIGDTAKAYLEKHAKGYNETDEKCIEQFIDNYKEAINNSMKLIESQKDNESINPICTIHKLVKLLENINQRNHEGYIFTKDHEEEFIESYI